MAHSLAKVLDRMEALTRNGRANWRQSGRPAELLSPLPSGVIVVLSRNPFIDPTVLPPGPYRLSILSESGSELAYMEARVRDEYYARLHDLYARATEQATDVDRRIDLVERELAALGA